MLNKFFPLLFLVSCFSSKPSTEDFYRVEKTMMGMPLCIQVEKKGNLDPIIATTFHEIDTIYNNWNPASEISMINALGSGVVVELSKELSTFLAQIEQIVVLTEGKFDPTIDPLQRLWKSHLKRGLIPTQKQIREAVDGVGWSHIHLKGRLLYKDHPKTSLDLSAISKGYAVDLLAERLSEAGFAHVYVEWGGEIRTIGSHPSGRKWKIALLGTDIIETENEAIATSGSYLQMWKIDNKYYTHFIDPLKKEPLCNHPISSASVLMESCLMADAIATTLMLFPSSKEAKIWFDKHFPQAKSWVIENASLRDPSLVSSLFPL